MSKFNTSNAANSIVNIIQTSIGNAAFDTTIRAIVQEKVDEATGKFKLQYQDGLFYAFADDVKVNYSKGTEVFVLVPKNDFTQDKRIIGSVKTLGENYAKVYSEDERYKKIGASSFGENDEDLNFGIKSAWKKDSTSPLQNSEVILDLVPDAHFLNYLRQDGVDGIWLEATFTTDNLEWVENANYGLTVTFNLQNQDGTDSVKTLDLAIDTNNMVGNPFSLYNERQVVVFGLSAEATIDFSHITGINSVSLWSKGFTTPVDENNIFVKDIKMYAVSAISETQLDAPNAEIWTKNGTYITENTGVPLQAQLKIKGKVQTDVKYFWFEEDLSINKDSGADYHVYGGRGWKLLNTTTPNGDGTFKIEETDKNILWVYDNTGSSTETNMLQTQLDIPKRLYKCVIAKSDSERYEAIVEVTNSKISSYSYVIKRVVTQEGQKEYKDVNSSVSLQENDEFVFAVVGNDDVLQTNVSWYKKDLFDTEWSPIDDDPDNEGQLKIAYASITTQKQIRAMVNGVMTQTVTLIAEAKIPDPTPQYQLVIVNTDQTFIYDENGRSPTHPAKTFKENEPKPLSFKLYDTYAKGDGYDITNQIQEFKWEINSSGLINPITNGEQQMPEGGWAGSWNQLNFTLKDAWSYNTIDNQITLTVKYTDATITAKTNFTFLKQGDPGTNGTDVAIVVTGTPNFNDDGTYKDGLTVKKYIGSEAIPLDGVIPQEITYKKGDVTVKTGVYKATVKEEEDSKVYYGYYVPPITINDTAYHLVGKPSQYVVYDADGTNPKYADFQFEGKGSDGNWESVEVTFNGKSSLYLAIPETFDSALAASEGVFQIAVQASNGTVITTITLLASLNRHAFSMVNGWDGNLKIDEDNNYILSATVAAGKKNEDNTFTGVMIGSLSNRKTGFFGYNQGVQTAFIDAETGSASFGSTKGAQFKINIDTTENKDSNNKTRDNSSVEFTVPYLVKIITDKAETSKWEDRSLLKISANDYYLQSANYDEDNTGTYINLKDGTIYANQAYLAQGVFLQEQGGGGYRSVGAVLESLDKKIETLTATMNGNQLAIQYGTYGIATFSSAQLGAAMGAVAGDGLFWDGTELHVYATDINTGLVNVYDTISSKVYESLTQSAQGSCDKVSDGIYKATFGQLGGEIGSVGSSSTLCIALKSFAPSGGYLYIGDSGVRFGAFGSGITKQGTIFVSRGEDGNAHINGNGAVQGGTAVYINGLEICIEK